MSNRTQERITRISTVVPDTVHLPPQTLPAAGAFTNQTAFIVPSGVQEITFWVTYTRGAAGGFPIFKPLYGKSGLTATYQDIVEDEQIHLAQPDDTQNIYQQIIEGPHPADGNPLTYVIPIRMPKTVATVRLIAAEKGVVATPGTIAINLTGG